VKHWADVEAASLDDASTIMLGGSHGTAVDTAATFNFIVSDWEDLRRIIQVCVIGGQSLCSLNPASGFPIAIENCRMRFFQNRLPWKRFGETYTFKFFARLVWEMLSRPEKQWYAFYRTRGLSLGEDFFRVFKSVVTTTNSQLRGMPQADAVAKYQFIADIITSPSELSKRKARIANFEF